MKLWNLIKGKKKLQPKHSIWKTPLSGSAVKRYWGDSDKDTVINGLDCAPRNRRKQGPQHMKPGKVVMTNKGWRWKKGVGDTVVETSPFEDTVGPREGRIKTFNPRTGKDLTAEDLDLNVRMTRHARDDPRFKEQEEASENISNVLARQRQKERNFNPLKED